MFFTYRIMTFFFIGCAVLGLMVLKCVVVGAKCQFAWTKEKGVFSLILFFTAWILLFKPMAAWAFVLGFNEVEIIIPRLPLNYNPHPRGTPRLSADVPERLLIRVWINDLI